MRIFISSLSEKTAEPKAPFKLVLDDADSTNTYVSSFMDDKELRQRVKVFRPLTNDAPNTVDYNSSTLDDILIRSGGEDCAPYRIYGSTIGGNHGYYKTRWYVPEHNKQDVDIGSLWLDNNSNQVVLVGIRDANYLYFSRRDLNGGSSATPLVHISGGTNTSDVSSSTFASVQMYPAIQNRAVTLTIDGIEKPIVNGEYESNSDIVFNEYYEIMNKDSIMEWMIDNVGTLGSNQQYGGTSDVKVRNIIRYTRLGNTLENSFEAINDIPQFQDIMFVMGFQMDESVEYPNLKQYIPKTIPFTDSNGTFDFANIEDVNYLPLASRIDIGGGRSLPTGILPDRNIYLLDGLGFSMGYLPIYDADPSVRRTRANNKAMQIAETGKIYMSAIDDNGQSSLTAGNSFKVVAYKNFFYRSENRTCYYIVDADDGSYYLYADWHTLPYSDSLEIPTELVGKTITLIEKSDNVSYTGTQIGATLDVTITDSESYGYLILKL